MYNKAEYINSLLCCFVNSNATWDTQNLFMFQRSDYRDAFPWRKVTVLCSHPAQNWLRGQCVGILSGCAGSLQWLIYWMAAICWHCWSVSQENDGSSLQTAGLASLQLTALWIVAVWHTCRIITGCVWLVGSEVGVTGCTWVPMSAAVASPIKPTFDVLLVFSVLVECAGFGRQQGHVVTERVQCSTVSRGGSLTELLCHLCNV